jgi:hypothetical protein
MIEFLIATALSAGQDKVSNASPSRAEVERAKSLAELQPCNAAKAQVLVGRLADTATVEQAMKLSSSLSVRIVRSGDPMSMEHWTDRITVELDNQGKILRLSCG